MFVLGGLQCRLFAIIDTCRYACLSENLLLIRMEDDIPS